MFLVSLRIRSSQRSPLHNDTNFGFGTLDHGRLIFVARSTIWRQTSPRNDPFPRNFLRRRAMTDPDRQKQDPAQASEPVVSKPYVMPDEPEQGSVEMLTGRSPSRATRCCARWLRWRTCASVPAAK